MQIFLNQTAEAVAKSFFTKLDSIKSGRGNIFLKALRRRFERNGYFRLSAKEVAQVKAQFPILYV